MTMKLSLLKIALASAVLSVTFGASSSAVAKQDTRRDSLRVDVSFTRKWSRYPAPDAIIATLLMQFPNVQYSSGLKACFVIDQNNESLLGQSNALTGTPSIKDPNSSFLVWYSGCVKSFLLAENESFLAAYSIGTTPAATASKFMNQKLIDLCPLPQKGSFPAQPSECSWASLGERARQDAIIEEIEIMIGPDDVVRDLRIAPSIEELARRIDVQLLALSQDGGAALKFLEIDSSKGGVLAPIKASTAIRFLILLNDTLKY